MPETPPAPSCAVPTPPDVSRVAIAALHPLPAIADYRAALADAEACRRLGEYMLLSWYDRTRDFEAPQHVSECHEKGAIPGYVDYALSRGAELKVDINGGRFVFFYRRIEL